MAFEQLMAESMKKHDKKKDKESKRNQSLGSKGAAGTSAKPS